MARFGRTRPDPHQLFEPRDLLGIDPDASPALGPALEMVDRHRLSMEHERAGVGLG